MKQNLRYHQHGGETLEFAFVAIFYFTMLFAVFEFSRGLYVWNVLAESTRRGARVATVCPYKSDIPKNIAVFDDRAGSNGGISPVIPGLEVAAVTVNYLDDVGVVLNLTPDDILAGELSKVNFVQVTITHEHQMIFTNLFSIFVAGWTGTLNAPTFQTTLPVESLGADPTFKAPDPSVTCDY